MDAAALIAILFLPIGLFLFIAFRLARRGPWLITWLWPPEFLMLS